MNGGIAADTSLAKFAILGAIVVYLMTVVAVVVLSLFQPPNTASNIITVIGITSPLGTALLAYGIHGLVTAVDGRVTQLIQATAEKEHAKGAIEGLAVNPSVNVTSDDLAPALIERRKAIAAEPPTLERRNNGTTDPDAT